MLNWGQHTFQGEKKIHDNEREQLTIFIDDTGPMLFTNMSTSMTVGLTVEEKSAEAIIGGECLWRHHTCFFTKFKGMGEKHPVHKQHTVLFQVPDNFM